MKYKDQPYSSPLHRLEGEAFKAGGNARRDRKKMTHSHSVNFTTAPSQSSGDTESIRNFQDALGDMRKHFDHASRDMDRDLERLHGSITHAGSMEPTLRALRAYKGEVSEPHRYAAGGHLMGSNPNTWSPTRTRPGLKKGGRSDGKR